MGRKEREHAWFRQYLLPQRGEVRKEREFEGEESFSPSTHLLRCKGGPLPYSFFARAALHRDSIELAEVRYSGLILPHARGMARFTRGGGHSDGGVIMRFTKKEA